MLNVQKTGFSGRPGATRSPGVPFLGRACRLVAWRPLAAAAGNVGSLRNPSGIPEEVSGWAPLAYLAAHVSWPSPHTEDLKPNPACRSRPFSPYSHASLASIQYSVMVIRGNGVTLRTQKVIQGGDNGHVGRPC
jgi:hypothetical protein